VDLLLLGYFKYVNFGLHSIAAAAHWFRRPVQFDFVDVVLPVGISFYTFHTITYIVDCYRGVVQPTRNFFEFACYVSLYWRDDTHWNPLGIKPAAASLWPELQQARPVTSANSD
jgi:hypothetical protein